MTINTTDVSTQRNTEKKDVHNQKLNSRLPSLILSDHSEWLQYKLGELVINIVAGATPKTSIKDYWLNGTIPWMSSGEVHKKLVKTTDKFITQKGYDNSSTKMIPINSILIALAGQGKTRGTVAINKIELCTNQSIAAIIPDSNKLYYEFLFYYLESKYDKLRRLSSSDGGRGGLNLKLLRAIRINIPSLNEQKKIASFLFAVDQKISLMEKKYS
ncbi:restriction endonuclease subunit S, partial [Methanosphaera sp. WGK6]|uniref:restriction endonuclease subunit S n=1 Tax=Methanosphaera sp. WGK6 TaxID=1561964 RepID=UPI000A5AD65A